MRITLFRDLKEENWPSMNRYANLLVRECKMQKSASGDSANLAKCKVNEFTVERKNITPSNALNLYFTRYLYYPLKARKRQGDVNHIVDHSYGHLAYALDPSKTVVTCHDLNPLKHEESWLNLRLFKYSVGGLKKAARIISDSAATKKDLIKFLGIAPDKIRVIPLGVEEKFRVAEKQRKYDLPNGKIILHVGGSGYNKNVEGILNALSTINNQQSTIFVKVGSDFTGSQKSLIKKLCLEDRVKYLGQVSEDDLVALYNLADVFVFPSFYEGFGLPILEAMACGTPVVTSNCSSMPEVAGEAAILVDPYNVESIAEGISRVIYYHTTEYGKRPQRLVQRGLERAKKFTWKRTAEETSKVYEEIYDKIPNNKFQITNKFQISNSSASGDSPSANLKFKTS
jgi:glycosyltransferase involved in cell wall biosynthesis